MKTRHDAEPPDPYAKGPGALLCNVCGYDFDPIATRWMCPHCKAKWSCCEGAPLPERKVPS